MADRLSKRTKKQKPGLIEPHTSALDSSDALTGSQTARVGFFAPRLGRSVDAETLDDAVKMIDKENAKQESGDGR